MRSRTRRGGRSPGCRQAGRRQPTHPQASTAGKGGESSRNSRSPWESSRQGQGRRAQGRWLDLGAASVAHGGVGRGGAGLEAPPPGWPLLPGPCVSATCALLAVIADVTSRFCFGCPRSQSNKESSHVEGKSLSWSVQCQGGLGCTCAPTS